MTPVPGPTLHERGPSAPEIAQAILQALAGNVTLPDARAIERVRALATQLLGPVTEADAWLPAAAEPPGPEREIEIAREILRELSAGNRQDVATTLANIRALANELLRRHRSREADLSHPGSEWTDPSGEPRHGPAA